MAPLTLEVLKQLAPSFTESTFTLTRPLASEHANQHFKGLLPFDGFGYSQKLPFIKEIFAKIPSRTATHRMCMYYLTEPSPETSGAPPIAIFTDLTYPRKDEEEYQKHQQVLLEQHYGTGRSLGSGDPTGGAGTREMTTNQSKLDTQFILATFLFFDKGSNRKGTAFTALAHPEPQRHFENWLSVPDSWCQSFAESGHIHAPTVPEIQLHETRYDHKGRPVKEAEFAARSVELQTIDLFFDQETLYSVQGYPVLFFYFPRTDWDGSTSILMTDKHLADLGYYHWTSDTPIDHIHLLFKPVLDHREPPELPLEFVKAARLTRSMTSPGSRSVAQTPDLDWSFDEQYVQMVDKWSGGKLQEW